MGPSANSLRKALETPEPDLPEMNRLHLSELRINTLGSGFFSKESVSVSLLNVKVFHSASKHLPHPCHCRTLKRKQQLHRFGGAAPLRKLCRTCLKAASRSLLLTGCFCRVCGVGGRGLGVGCRGLGVRPKPGRLCAEVWRASSGRSAHLHWLHRSCSGSPRAANAKADAAAHTLRSMPKP